MTIRKLEYFRPVLKECFQADRELLQRWHIAAGKGLNACVDKTYRDMLAAGVSFFAVSISDELVGYFGKECCGDKEFLTGFFIMPDMRTSEVKAQFWSLVKSQFETPFLCGLYEKNLPARKFIESRGGRLIQNALLPDGTAVLYKIGV